MRETATLTLTASPDYIVGSPGAATAIISSDDASPTITVAATDNTATEAGPTSATFTATRTASSTPLLALSVPFTMGGPAINGSDYSLSSGSFSFSAGATTAMITLTAVNDTVLEGDETAVLTLAASPNYTIGSPNSAPCTITSDEGPPAPSQTVMVVATDATAGEAGPNSATFTATRTGNTTGSPSVSFTMGGTEPSTATTRSPRRLLLPGRGRHRYRHSQPDQRQRGRGR